MDFGKAIEALKAGKKWPDMDGTARICSFG